MLFYGDLWKKITQNIFYLLNLIERKTGLPSALSRFGYFVGVPTPPVSGTPPRSSNRPAFGGQFSTSCGSKEKATLRSPFLLSGRRVSNPRPQPWQGCALPTELLPRGFLRKLAICFVAVRSRSSCTIIGTLRSFAHSRLASHPVFEEINKRGSYQPFLYISSPFSELLNEADCVMNP